MKYIKLNLKRFLDYDTIDVEVKSVTKVNTGIKNTIKDLKSLSDSIVNTSKNTDTFKLSLANLNTGLTKLQSVVNTIKKPSVLNIDTKYAESKLENIKAMYSQFENIKDVTDGKYSVPAPSDENINKWQKLIQVQSRISKNRQLFAEEERTSQEEMSKTSKVLAMRIKLLQQELQVAGKKGYNDMPQVPSTRSIDILSSSGITKSSENEEMLARLQKRGVDTSDITFAAPSASDLSNVERYNNLLTTLTSDIFPGLKDTSAMELLTAATSNVSKAANNTGNIFQRMASKMRSSSKQVASDVKTSFVTIYNIMKKVNETSKSGASIWSIYSKNVVSNLVKFRIIGGAIKGVATEFNNLYTKAAEYEEALNLYTVALGDYAEAGRTWAEKISKALYLDPANILQYTGAIKSLAEGLGVASKDANLMAKNITQLSYDMSSYLNIDVQSVYDKLQSGLSGQVRGLRQVGVAITNASLQELAYKLNINKSISSMTEREKVYLRYIQIMRQSTNMQGDLARTLMTPENALRMVKTQFVQLGRAIGQVFIPIAMKAIPYIMALTNMLTNLANRLSSMLGYKIADVDYSSLTKVDNTVEDIGKSAASSTKKLKGMLAPFDELNVVQSKASSAGGGATDTIDFSKYLTGYDMLQGLNDKFKSQVKGAEAQIKKLLTVVGLLAVAWKAKRILNFANNLKKLTSESKTAKKILDLLVGVLPKLKGLTVVGTTLVAFKGSESILYDWASGAKDAKIQLEKLILLVGGTAGLAAIVLSPWAAGITILGGITGALMGISKAEYEVRKEKITADLFNDAGIAFDTLIDKYDKAFEGITKYNTKQEELQGSLDTSKEKLEAVTEKIGDTFRAIDSGDYKTHKEEIDAIKDAYNNWAIAAGDVSQKETDLYISTIDNLKQTGVISDEEYKRRKKNAEELLELELAQQKGYASELAELQIKLKEGTITQEEYNQGVENLHKKYVLVDGDITRLKTTTDGYVYGIEKGINLKNFDDTSNKVNKLKKYFDDLEGSLKSNHETTQNNLEIELDKLEQAKNEYESMGDTSSAAYKKVKDSYEDTKNTIDDNEKQYNENLNKINSTRKDAFLTIFAQLKESGADTLTEFSGVTNTIKSELSGLTDVDMSKSVTNMFDTFTQSMEREGKKFSAREVSEFQTYGADWSDELINTFVDDTSKNLVNRQSTLNQSSKNVGVEMGENAGLGYAQGIYSGGVDKSVMNAIGGPKKGGLVGNTYTCLQKAQDSHSPSKVFEGLGIDAGLGYGNGISDNSVISNANSSVKTLVDAVERQLKSKQFGISIDTNVDNSLNIILGKVQKFCNSWQNAINDLVKNMKSTMNGIKIDSSGKVSYTKMPKVNVERFDGGGLPQSGDLFFANENGRAEWVSSVGNKTAVANQDQIATVVTNAVIAGFSKLRPMNNEPSTTNVYIGNDKVYSGQGEYQNRQSDRYGTTRTIKV